MEDINIAEAKSSFSTLVSRTSAGERFVIRRRGRAVAALINPAELERLERNAQISHRLALALGQDTQLLERITNREIHPAMAAFGLWRDDEMDALTNENYAEREGAGRRPAVDYENPG